MRGHVGPIVGGKAMQIRAGPERGGRWLLRCDDIKPGESRRARCWVALQLICSLPLHAAASYLVLENEGT